MGLKQRPSARDRIEAAHDQIRELEATIIRLRQQIAGGKLVEHSLDWKERYYLLSKVLDATRAENRALAAQVASLAAMVGSDE